MSRKNLAIGLIFLASAGCNQGMGTSTPSDAAAEREPSPQAANDVAPAEPQAAEPAVTERVKAAVGVGQKGRSLDDFDKGVERVIAQPARMLFATQEKMVFEVQIPQALQLFQATEGRLPNSHEEFMSRIIQFNNI